MQVGLYILCYSMYIVNFTDAPMLYMTDVLSALDCVMYAVRTYSLECRLSKPITIQSQELTGMIL